jgi:WD40 repeat protein
MARLWDLRSRTLSVPSLPNEGWVFSVAFAPDGKSVITGSRENRSARIWDVATGMPLGPTLHGDLNAGTSAVAFHPDGSTVAVASYDGSFTLWRLPAMLPDDLVRAALTVEVQTGLTLDPTRGTIGVLDNASFRARLHRMQQAGANRHD